MTILLTPFELSAKLPIYAFLPGVFPSARGARDDRAVLAGILAGILVALLLRGTAFPPARRCPFVMELPGTHARREKTWAALLWDKGRDFCKSGAFTVIFIATIVIWFCRP